MIRHHAVPDKRHDASGIARVVNLYYKAEMEDCQRERGLIAQYQNVGPSLLRKIFSVVSTPGLLK